MNSLEYWRKREAEQLRKRIADEEERGKAIEKIYAEMRDAIQKQIDAFYGKYAKAEGISIAEAKKRASKLDIEAYARKAKKYVAEKNFTDKANAEMKLYNMTMKVNRLELLKAEIGSELCAGFSELEKEFDADLMNDAVSEMERQAGILGTTISDQVKRARGLVDASFHNATFSDRIWMYQAMLKDELSTLLQEGFVQGRNSKELARHLTKTFGVSASDAERLMRTEMTRVYTAAQHESLTEAGYDQYTFIAEPTACDVCKQLDGKHFPVEDLEDIGNHAPPIHPNCRCSVAAYMDREEFERWLDEKELDTLEPQQGVEATNKGMSERIATIIACSDQNRQMRAINQLLDDYGFPKSNWSGRVIIDDSIKSRGFFRRSTKNITLRSDAPIKTKIHEALHARTVYNDYTDVDDFVNKSINEGVVEFLAEWICRDNGITYSKTYVEPVKAIESIAGILKVDEYSFAKSLFEIPFADRYSWLDGIVDFAIESTEYSGLDKAMLTENMNILYGEIKK